MTNTKQLGILFRLAPTTVIVAAAISHSALAQTEESTNTDTYIEKIKIFGQRNALETTTGSGFVVNAEQLETFEYDDIHRVLQTVPGVYIREEDGYGLRPNIGLRGATAERSSKVALMEDGVLLAPAPYAAPAAYYFPNVSRMTQVELFKGPSAIAYGPNTVGGAINMLSRPVTADNEGQVDLSVGEQGYEKLHGHYNQTYQDFGALVEGLSIASDGFKALPSGADTGFEKREFISKLSYQPSGDEYHQRWELKYGYSDEVSDETYLGLTDADFAINPYQRYAASENDQFDSEHYQLQLTHYMELGADISILTQAYRRDFDRDWDRLAGFGSNRSIAAVLSSPDTGINSFLLQVLKGEQDSLNDETSLSFTLNDRNFYSQGLQTQLSYDSRWQDYDLSIDAGLRVHQDQVERLHRSRVLLMQSGSLMRDGSADEVITNNRDEVTAIAGFTNVRIQDDALNAVIGVRVESIDGQSSDFLTATQLDNRDTVVLPGAGIFYQLSPTIGLLAGVNRGYVPNSPGEERDIDPEDSWNYEFGLRSSFADWRIEAIGFFNDYSNLKGSCTFSSGCTTEDLDLEFNGGEVDIYGLEASLSGSFAVAELSVPIQLAYTYTESEFKTSFESDFAQWGDVQAGDELPYLPKQQLNAQLGLAGQDWQVTLAYKYTDEMSEAAGTGIDLEGVSTAALHQIDVAAWYQVTPALRAYAKLDNATDEAEIVSRRPFGARPGKPRQLSIGAKYQF